MDKINIEGLDKAELLKALYDASKPLGMGHMQFVSGDLDIEEARKYVGNEIEPPDYDNDPRRQARPLYFDYLKGRILKVDLTGPEMRTDLYDRDLGTGACARVVDRLRKAAV